MRSGLSLRCDEKQMFYINITYLRSESGDSNHSFIIHLPGCRGMKGLIVHEFLKPKGFNFPCVFTFLLAQNIFLINRLLYCNIKVNDTILIKDKYLYLQSELKKRLLRINWRTNITKHKILPFNPKFHKLLFLSSETESFTNQDKKTHLEGREMNSSSARTRCWHTYSCNQK